MWQWVNTYVTYVYVPYLDARSIWCSLSAAEEAQICHLRALRQGALLGAKPSMDVFESPSS